MEELTIATVNFNTPMYLMPLTYSLKKSNPWFNGKIHVYDNGDKKTIDEGNNIFYIGHYINNETLYNEFKNIKKPNHSGCRNFCSAKHCKAIDFIIKTTCSKYLLICDTDIVFIKNFKDLFNKFKNENFVACSYIRKTLNNADRFAPWFTLLNLEIIKKYNLNYYDKNRMLFLNNNNKNDTGSVLLEDCLKLKLKILEIPKDNYYYIHFKGGSYEPTNEVKKWLMKHKNYWL